MKMITSISISFPVHLPESGSCNPIITAAVKEQLDNYSQYTIAYTYGRKSIEYAERLTSVYPGGVPAKSFSATAVPMRMMRQ